MFTVDEIRMIRSLAAKLPPRPGEAPSKAQIASLVDQVERYDCEFVCLDIDARAEDGKLGAAAIVQALKDLLCAIWDGRADDAERRTACANALRYVSKLRGQSTRMACEYSPQQHSNKEV
ncbi:MAG: hypothetical protein COZ06_36085 [Armatimonadetes bacterium CG_4_10_14_3_um_filter_66_18]|nr:hypothetical protein [Armatimonadota bacterium]OIP08169.1 MAG: hypothetical protein AUJ96_06305 [Armatimonadetes bacterium CG2_30_66_41]PIU89410.1 MAG: hypothetical protein COS65_28620 [Armatimonadetes bacterium CG06_land_8_20_14_3_00_66_21]PIX39215.1 MAG: hypothetical protein COZ57_28705 [Armatimonadetes bacterium CG_4_8_14_3_um_filter_66_20]PIY36505.1 MAG: hypothetical protein COZ06_36085 [Armatimonadetes bacterium CG_4_10_14_3_um_filter_66_18]PIZ41541.1 MAG: hypothetical protein COY42_19